MSTNVVDKERKAIWNDDTGKLEIDDVPVDNKTMLDAMRNAFKMGWGNERIRNVICGPGWEEFIDKERRKWDKDQKARQGRK